MSAVGHHWRVIKQALAEERSRATTHTLIAEPDFLPAALEVIEKPVSPTARVTAWVALAGVALALTWVTCGQIDIVASAPGKVLPADDVKLVQAAATGIVRRIYVQDGQAVRKGEALIDLDPTVSAADEEQAAKALQSARLDVARNQAIADALAGKGIHFAPPEGTPTDVEATQRRLVEAQVASTGDAVEGLAAARQSALSDAAAAQRKYERSSATLPLLDQEVGTLERLDRLGLIPRTRLLEMQRQRHAEIGDRGIAVAERSRGISDAAKFSQQVREARDHALQEALGDLAKAQSEAALRAQELAKARQRSRLQRLVAPVDGTVEELAVHTIGGVIEPVRPIMEVVPHGALRVEAKVLNRDAGFVHSGQVVALKLEAFPFTQYGTIPGRIEKVSTDASDDRKLGAVYTARIVMLRSTIATADGEKRLEPGMSLTADVNTGRRSILRFLMSPIERASREAGHER